MQPCAFTNIIITYRHVFLAKCIYLCLLLFLSWYQSDTDMQKCSQYMIILITDPITGKHYLIVQLPETRLLDHVHTGGNAFSQSSSTVDSSWDIV